MSRILIIISTLLFMFNSTMNAQGTTAIYGFVVEKDSTAMTGVRGIPFCTVKYCDINDHNVVEYMGVTDLRGFYNLGENIPIKNYHVVIEAPGYDTISKDMGNFPTQELLTLHFEMTRSGSVPVAARQCYSLPYLKIQKKQKLSEAVTLIPGITVDEYGNMLTEEGGSVKILLGGQNVPFTDLAQFDEIPTSYVSHFEYYDITDFNTVYSGIVNIVLTTGQNTELTEKPFVTDMFDL